ncbi:hypothetical protein QM565_23410, partial [Geitlerinema splendidum]|nr:hypothetical protein [Geitlerinema splendidum]
FSSFRGMRDPEGTNLFRPIGGCHPVARSPRQRYSNPDSDRFPLNFPGIFNPCPKQVMPYFYVNSSRSLPDDPR